MKKKQQKNIQCVDIDNSWMEYDENGNMTKETVKKLVDFAIAQNPLVYKRLAEI